MPEVALSDTSLGWNEARLARAIVLFYRGYTASETAKDVGGGISRNAVSGVLHRRGFKRANTPKPLVIGLANSKKLAPPRQIATTTKQVTPKRIAAPSACVAPIPAPQTPTLTVVPSNAGANQAVLALGNHMCKWPIGDPGTESFTFCGGRCHKVYCTTHAELAYQKAPAPKRPAYA